MPMFIIFLIIAAVIVVGFFLIIAMQSGSFRVERSTSISAPSATVFGNVNDLHRWDAWSPWIGVDANLQQTYEGPSAGVGSVYSWVGKKTGAGRMTIIESRSNQLVKIKLEFFKPFKATNTVDFTFQPQGNQSTVTWAMYGPKNMIAKAMHMMVSMDKMVGGEFEQGLAKLKAVSEGAAK
jgi:hypothetical protein